MFYVTLHMRRYSEGREEAGKEEERREGRGREEGREGVVGMSVCVHWVSASVY